ncbi:MAG: hypothetical protein AB8G96_10860 [Phycisphaerales bacterium]
MSDGIAAERGQKVCVLCGADCAGQPRIKDPRGRYYHKACHEQAARERAMPSSAPVDLYAAAAVTSAAAAPPAFDDGPSFLDDILPSTPSHAAAAAGVCPNCGGGFAPSAVVCTSCGFDTRRGTAAHTRTLKAKKLPRAAGARPSHRGGGGFFSSSIGVFASMVFVGAAFSIVAVAGSGIGLLMASVALLVLALAVLAALLWTVIEAFSEGQTGWGVVNLIGLFVTAIPNLIYVFVNDVDPRLRGLLPGALLGYAMLIVTILFGVVLPEAMQMAEDEALGRQVLDRPFDGQFNGGSAGEAPNGSAPAFGAPAGSPGGQNFGP